MNFSGVVLAGGRSSRFGQDKAEYHLKGKPLLARVLESLGVAEERFIVADKAYDGYGVPTYPDLIVSQSPLGGLHTALSLAKHDWVAVAACDLPYLSAPYWEALAQYCSDNEAVVVKRGEQLEPLAAFYNKKIVTHAEQRLNAREFALHKFVASLDAKVIAWDSLALPDETLRNVNHPDDLV